MTYAKSIRSGVHLAVMMEEFGITGYRLAKTIGIPLIRIQEKINGRRAFTVGNALSIALCAVFDNGYSSENITCADKVLDYVEDLAIRS